MYSHLGKTTAYRGMKVETNIRTAGALQANGFFSAEADFSATLSGSAWVHTFPGRMLSQAVFNLEARLGWIGGDVPRPLASSTNEVFPLTTLGSPLFGAKWRGGELTGPLADGPATMAMAFTAPTERFGVVKVRLGWSPVHLVPKGVESTGKRLLGKLSVGGYQAFAGTHDGGVAGVLDDLHVHVESGVEVRLAEMYGVTLTVRMPVLQGIDLGTDSESWAKPGRLMSGRWGKEVVVGVKLDRTLFAGGEGI